MTLTGGVPDGDVVGPPLLEVESPSDGAHRVLKLPLRVPVEQRRLPDVHVSQENHLDVGLLHLGQLGHDVDRLARFPPRPDPTRTGGAGGGGLESVDGGTGVSCPANGEKKRL